MIEALVVRTKCGSGPQLPGPFVKELLEVAPFPVVRSGIVSKSDSQIKPEGEHPMIPSMAGLGQRAQSRVRSTLLTNNSKQRSGPNRRTLKNR